MVEMSKMLFDEYFGAQDCKYMLHPWGSGCWSASFTLYKDALIGSAKFYAIVYLIQIIMRGRKMKQKDQWRKMAEYYVRSTLLGQLVTATASNIGCILRNILGDKFTYYRYLLIPFTLNGLFIYLEHPSRRGLVINLFFNLYLEYWLRSFKKAGYISITKTQQTLLFMVGSSLLFYLMRLEGDKKQRTPLFCWQCDCTRPDRLSLAFRRNYSGLLKCYFWFRLENYYFLYKPNNKLYTPEKVRRKSDGHENPCPHNGPCDKYIAKGFATYFGVGLGITLARIILPRISSPIKAISSIRGQHFKLAMFFGSYIGIYRAVVCYLCRKKGFDSAMYALPAGYLAGLSFIMSPNLGIAIGSVTAAMKLYSTVLYEKKIIPTSIPLPELLYCICQGTLFNARVLHPDVCPKYVFNLMKTVSSGRSESIVKNITEVLKRIPPQ